MVNEIIKERMLRNLKKSIAWHWGLGDDGERILRELYLTDLKGSCMPDKYLGDDCLKDIYDKFYYFLQAVRDEFKEFIEIYVIASYEDATGYIMIFQDKLLLIESEKAWHFWHNSEEELADEMYRIYDILLTKTERTWGCCTLSEDDIKAVAERREMSLEGIDLDEVIHYVRKGIEAALDNRDEIIREAIGQARRISQCQR